MGKKGLKLLAGLGVLWSVTKTLFEWLGNIDFIAESLNEPGWIREVYTFLHTPSPTSNLLVFSISLSLFGCLRYYEKRKREPPRYITLPQTSTFQVSWVKKERTPETPSPISEVSQPRLDEEWDNLDEGDREVAREIVLTGGLMEPDIIALLKARGFLPYDSAYEPIADRVSFIHCDYVGYHSIAPGFQSLVEEKIAEEYRDDSFSK